TILFRMVKHGKRTQVKPLINHFQLEHLVPYGETWQENANQTSHKSFSTRGKFGLSQDSSASMLLSPECSKDDACGEQRTISYIGYVDFILVSMDSLMDIYVAKK
uniref:Uncharacterized protein n=1 Tax=Clytia hemisphaerica TaxID=252671 RepID=A0A7M6DNK3_9CNID